LSVSFIERSQDRRTAKNIDLSRELGGVAIGTLCQAFRATPRRNNQQSAGARQHVA